ncbi:MULTISPECIES: hypothetical protein [Streptomyces]|uniref:WXG100 family type VII secretion target n=2 Tax=Streptomyces TaxID=1883 RepID=A0A494V330_9ACTN|nr:MULTISPECIES: hypothetical protein [Streptomyces]AYL37539.1 hypothetical protein CNQ36_20290 [Streptomyces fungicidicus]EFL39848.1 hypothetical protein SSRG_02652 [Streptomyces griseoflavus Tu4000]
MSRETDCREDLRKLKKYADELELAVDNVQHLCGEDTWKGPKSERFRSEFAKHKKEIKNALTDARAAMAAALKRVEQEEADKKKTASGS